MKRYKIWWTEKCSAIVDANNEEEAFEKAMSENQNHCCDWQTIEDIEEREVEQEVEREWEPEDAA